jgi:phosphate transport system permease protein
LIRERGLQALLIIGTAGTLAALAALTLPLLVYSFPFLTEKGAELLTSMNWDPMRNHFGGLQFILGTLWVTFWSTLISIPLSLSLALLSSELAPRKLRGLIATLTDLIAAVPSVIYGYWGLMVFGPLLVKYVYPALQALSGLPLIGALFAANSLAAQCYMTAILVLSLMITPYAAVIMRNSYEMIPRDLIEAVYALGGTKWDVIWINLGYIKSSIIAGVILAAGRAMGETMAVTMLVGNNVGPFKPCLLCKGATITSVVANEFGNAMTAAHREALTALILVLIIMGMVLLSVGRKLSKTLLEAEVMV